MIRPNWSLSKCWITCQYVTSWTSVSSASTWNWSPTVRCNVMSWFWFVEIYPRPIYWFHNGKEVDLGNVFVVTRKGCTNSKFFLMFLRKIRRLMIDTKVNFSFKGCFKQFHISLFWSPNVRIFERWVRTQRWWKILNLALLISSDENIFKLQMKKRVMFVVCAFDGVHWWHAIVWQ